MLNTGAQCSSANHDCCTCVCCSLYIMVGQPVYNEWSTPFGVCSLSLCATGTDARTNGWADGRMDCGRTHVCLALAGSMVHIVSACICLKDKCLVNEWQRTTPVALCFSRTVALACLQGFVSVRAVHRERLHEPAVSSVHRRVRQPGVLSRRQRRLPSRRGRPRRRTSVNSVGHFLRSFGQSLTHSLTHPRTCLLYTSPSPRDRG